jgi:hypothetical protein
MIITEEMIEAAAIALFEDDEERNDAFVAEMDARGMGVWATELAELDGRAAAKYLRPAWPQAGAASLKRPTDFPRRRLT